MKPTNLKEIAKKFASIYYPQWLSRVDRIWTMFHETGLNNVVPPASITSQYQLTDGLALAGETEPKFKEFITGIAIFAFTYQGLRKEQNVSDVDLQERISTTCISHKLAPDLKAKLEGILSDILPSMVEEAVQDEKETKLEYRVWYKDSEPTGKLIGPKEKEQIMATEKERYDLLILREETLTQVFINGKKAQTPPGKLAYRILVYVLKHKGAGGTAWNIAKHVWNVSEVKEFGDLREIAKALQQQEKLEEGKLQELAGITKDKVADFSNLVRRRISDLNKSFLIILKTKLEANAMDEYELTKTLQYCLIEKLSDF